MNLNHLTDALLLATTKSLAASEREVLVKILHHLREIERRRLFSELGYSSLFYYAVKELHYSEGQAGRRIQAMRLIKEIPAVETAIASGELSLSNVAQAQSLFRNMNRQQPKKPVAKAEKLAVLSSLKNLSTRDGQRALLKLQPQAIDSRTFEKERPITEDASEVRFLMSDTLKTKLDSVRGLLGTKGLAMGYAELFEAMADLSAQKLAELKFGKKRAAAGKGSIGDEVGNEPKQECSTPAPELRQEKPKETPKNSRYISKAVQHIVWHRDGGKCCNCGSKINLNIDHLIPVALGGRSDPENLRLLCFFCNQRQAIKIFGIENVGPEVCMT